jgi:hypothetical protein
VQQTGSAHEGFENAARGGKLPWIGKVCVVADHEYDESNLYRYEYSPLFTNSDVGIAECLAWKPAAPVVLESALWWVKNYNHVTVLRNRRWWAEVGQPAYETFWRTVQAARLDGRYSERRAAVPLFVSDDSAEEENDRASRDNEGDADDEANVDSDSDGASDVVGWQGQESDHSTGWDNTALSGNDSDLESEVPTNHVRML